MGFHKASKHMVRKNFCFIFVEVIVDIKGYFGYYCYLFRYYLLISTLGDSKPIGDYFADQLFVFHSLKKEKKPSLTYPSV
jgi:hypothetical protein